MREPAELGEALALIQSGDPARAEQLLRSLTREDSSAEALNLLAFSVQQQGRMDESVALWTRAAELDPGRADLLSNLAGALLMLRREADAAQAARQAIALDPNRADAHANLGGALRRLGDWDGAITALARAVELRPDFPSYRNNLGDLLQQTGHIEAAIATLRPLVAEHPENLKARSDLLMAMNYSDQVSAAELFGEARHFGEVATARAKGRAMSGGSAPREPGPLRIGFVSGDLRTHSVARFLPGALGGLKARGVQLFAYPTRPREDETTLRLKPLFTRWTPIDRMRDSEAVRAIAADRLDVLVDLSSHSGGNRLPVFAYRPAPITATWIGYSGTTGLGEMDYIIADRFVLPAEDEPHYTERPWRLPDCYLLFSPPQDTPEIAPLPAATSGRITFGSFNNLAKVSDATLDSWGRLLQSVPGSRLLLKSPTLPEATAHRLMANRLAARGIGPNRFAIMGRMPQASTHLAAYAEVDIALDPFPYAGTTTTFEALWMGRPVLTLRGNRFTARVGDSVLSNLGLSDWVAATVDDYVRVGSEKAADIGALQVLSTSLRNRMRVSPLCDSERFADGLLAAFEGMIAAKA